MIIIIIIKYYTIYEEFCINFDFPWKDNFLECSTLEEQ